MRNPRVLIVVAIVISLPIFFGLLGGTRNAGLIIGIACVAAGVLIGVLGARRSPDDV